MARIEFIGVPSQSGRLPVAHTRLGVDGDGEALPERVVLFESPRNLTPPDQDGDPDLKLIAVSDLDLDSVMDGALLLAGSAVLTIIRTGASRNRVFADVVESGETGSGEDLSFERRGRANAGVLTLSDSCSRGEREDLSGPALVEALVEAGLQPVRYAVSPDDRAVITGRLISWCDDGSCDLILTTGGTGLSPSDSTPEATMDAIERQVPGIPELMRQKSAETVQTSWLSRSVAGIRGGTLVVNLPGSRKGAVECFGYIRHLLGHALEVAGGRVSRCGG